jgi:chromosome segregation ATPase
VVNMKIVILTIACVGTLALIGPQLLAQVGRYNPPLPLSIRGELNTIQRNNRLLEKQIAQTTFFLGTHNTDLSDIRREYAELQSGMKLLIQRVENEMDSGTLRDDSLRVQLNAVKQQSEQTLTAFRKKESWMATGSDLDQLLANLSNSIENYVQYWKEYNESEAERQREAKKVLDAMLLPDWDAIRPSLS